MRRGWFLSAEILFTKGSEMRELSVSDIAFAVENALIKANTELPPSIEAALKNGAAAETVELSKAALECLLDNIKTAKETSIPLCQDTGLAVIFAEIGQEIHIKDGLFEDAVNAGVAAACKNGALRASVVSDPLERKNTGDNTPAIIHMRLVAGDRLKLIVAPKGMGSENMSTIKMFTPSAAIDDITAFVKETVKTAGSNPCPPVVVGVGIGGNFEGAALLAKKAVNRDISKRHPRYGELEIRLLDEINALGIGAQGFGGALTAIAVNIETGPTHIAGLPVAVNIGCHVARHVEINI